MLRGELRPILRNLISFDPKRTFSNRIVDLGELARQLLDIEAKAMEAFVYFTYGEV